MRGLCTRAVLAGILGSLVALAPAVRAEGWGTIKGRVVWDGAEVPKREELKAAEKEKECLKRGPLLSETYVVNPKNKGVRWVMVWLVDSSNPKKKLPIAPSQKSASLKPIEFDQPCCMFEPHVFGVREGQKVVAKNSAKIPHNVNVQAITPNPSLNQLMPPGTDLTLPPLKASPTPIQVSCNIHPWMKAYVRVFNHPYFAVTDEDGNFEIKDAPAGDFNLVVWQENNGWVVPVDSPAKTGMTIAIKADEVTTLKDIPLKPSKD